MPTKKKRQIPYVHERDDRMFVRIPYRVGDKWKTKERRVTTVDEAMRVIHDLKEDLGRLGPEAFDGDKMSFDKLLHQYKLAHPDKPRWYLDPLADYFGKRLIRSITYGDLRQFRAAREKIKSARDGADRKPATINREVEQLRAVILFAVRHGWLRFNPFAAGPPLIAKSDEEQRVRVPTPAEEMAILAACVPPREHLRPLVIATRDTGLRRSALLAIEWQHVDLDAGLLFVPRARSAHKGRPKVIALTSRLKAEMTSLFGEGKEPGEKVFGIVAARGMVEGGQVDNFKRSWKTACRLAGVEGLRFNDFRHGFATDLMEAGVAERLAMKAGGHSNPATHAIYTNVDERLARQVATALDRLHAQRAGDPLATEPESGYVN